MILFPIVLKNNKINLVHQNLPMNPNGVLREYLINLWCRLMHVPVVLHLHGGIFLMNGSNNLFFKKLSKSLFKHSEQVVVLSEIERESISDKYNYSSAKVLCNSIDVALYKTSQKQLSSNKPIVLFLGRIHESKGVDDIIEAFRLLKDKIDFRFFLCGTGPLKDHFVTDCEKLLGPDFEFYGIVTGDAKMDVINKSDIFLLPSRYGEGLPMALLETMAAGVLPVVTDDASMKYLVKHQVNGILVEKRNPHDLFEKLKLILLDRILYQKLSCNAAKTIAENYDVGSYVVKLNKIYELAVKMQN